MLSCVNVVLKLSKLYGYEAIQIGLLVTVDATIYNTICEIRLQRLDET